MLVVGLVGGGVHVLFNPIGMHRLEGVEARLRQGLKELRPGVGLAEIRQFCVREGLEMGEPSEEFWHPGDPPEGAKWEVRGMHPYEAHYYGGSAWIFGWIEIRNSSGRILVLTGPPSR